MVYSHLPGIPPLQDKDKDKQNQQHWGLTFLTATTTLTIGSLARVGLFANNNNYEDEDDKDKGLLHRISTQPKLTALVAVTAKETRARELALLFRRGARRFNGGDFPPFPEG